MAAEEKKELRQDICCTFDHQINVDQRVELIVDCHMHIESNNTAPLPLVWDKNTLLKILKPSKSTLNFFGNFSFISKLGTVAKIGKDATHQVAETAIGNNDRTFPPKENKLIINVVMPMDMEYGHFDGYFGNKVYTQGSRKKTKWRWHGSINLPESSMTEFFIYNSRNPEASNERKEYVMPENELKLFENFQMQMERTKYAVIKNPFRFMPMYHFDPRRWNTKVNKRLVNAKGGLGVESANEVLVAPGKEQQGLKDPFDEMVGHGGMFIGIKMYTALGYMPDDPNLPVLQKLYDFCESNEFPIICHGTKAGMYTLDKSLFAELLEADYGQQPLKDFPDPDKVGFDETGSYGGSIHFYDQMAKIYRENEEIIEANSKKAVEWFNKKYISPRDAWGPVLQKFPNLKVCIAHFTGDAAKEYDDADGWDNWIKWIKDNEGADPGGWFKEKCKDSWIIQMCELVQNKANVYIDLSYVLLKDKKKPFEWLLKKYPKLKERLLFGTDWHLVEIDIDYTRFCNQNREVLESFGEGLWERFTCHNPLRFFRFKEIADKFHAALKSETGGFVKKAKSSGQSGYGKKPTSSAGQSIQDEALTKDELDWVGKNSGTLETIANKRKQLLINTRESKWEI